MACSSPASSPSGTITRLLTEADIPCALPLSVEAGWNQVEADWRAFIRLGQAWGVEHEGGGLVASAAVLPYGAFGFTSMVLVTAAWRRRGLATALVQRCIGALRARGAVPVLDATPAGRTVYRTIGFLDVLPLDRWEGPGSGGEPQHPAGPGDHAEIATLDAEAFGAERGSLLRNFHDRPGSRLFVERGGFALVRAGRRAAQIGPVVARDQRQGLRLVQRALSGTAGLMFIDVPTRWATIGRWLQRHGFTLQRSFTRMVLGSSAPFGDPRRYFAAAGPEFG